MVKKVSLKITPHFKFEVQYSTVQYSLSTVQYSTVQYSIGITGIWIKIGFEQNLFHLIWKIFLLTKSKCNLNFSKKLYNCKYEDIIWLAWERVYFRLKIFLFRKSILWNVIKKKSLCSLNRQLKTRSLVEACATIGRPQHSTA